MARRGLIVSCPTGTWLPLAEPGDRPTEPPGRFVDAGWVLALGRVVTVTVDATQAPRGALPLGLMLALPKPHHVRPTQVHLGDVNPHGRTAHDMCDVLADYCAANGARLLVTCDEPHRLRETSHRLYAWRRLFEAQRLAVEVVEE